PDRKDAMKVPEVLPVFPTNEMVDIADFAPYWFWEVNTLVYQEVAKLLPFPLEDWSYRLVTWVLLTTDSFAPVMDEAVSLDLQESCPWFIDVPAANRRLREHLDHRDLKKPVRIFWCE